MRLPYKSGTVRISSNYGQRWLNGELTQHNGVDLVGSDKQIVTVADGVVLQSRWKPQDPNNEKDLTWQWGNYVSIQGDDGNVIYYCHMSQRNVQQGQRVHAGDVIGIEGNTGYSFGTHCHFEVRRNNIAIDPTKYLGITNATGNAYTVNPEPEYADLVCKKCGFEGKTRVYLDSYQYAPDLWRKLWEAMK